MEGLEHNFFRAWARKPKPDETRVIRALLTMVNIEVDVENFVELLTELLDGQYDVVDVAKARRLKNKLQFSGGISTAAIAQSVKRP